METSSAEGAGRNPECPPSLIISRLPALVRRRVRATLGVYVGFAVLS